VSGMQAHASDADTQRSGILAILALTDTHKAELNEAGAWDAVVAAMDAHTTDEYVQSRGGLVLDFLSLE
jgi:hypothetical protein